MWVLYLATLVAWGLVCALMGRRVYLQLFDEEEWWIPASFFAVAWAIGSVEIVRLVWSVVQGG